MPTSLAPEAPLRVGYILKMFPRLSETFILNELLEHERQGTELSIFSLMHPDEGRFHGRLGQLRAAVDFVPREKPETTWEFVRATGDDLTPSFARWEEAADFLRQWGIPKDLDLLLRAVCIARHVRQRGIQHLHAHFATVATQMAALVNILCGVPFSFTAHAKDIFRQTVNRQLYADLARRAAFHLTVSDFNRVFILEHTPGLAPDRVIRLYNGVDLDFFPPVARRKPGSTPHFLSVGRLVPKKGFRELLDAVHLRQQAGLPLRLTIVGDGEQHAELVAHAAALGLTRAVTFTGALPQEQVRALCAEADVMVLACVADAIGNQDALPTTLIEALACDLPIVSTTMAGVPEIVPPEVGRLVAPGDVPALAQALEDVWQRVRAGTIPAGVARARAEHLFDQRLNVATQRELFRRSARASPRGGAPA